MSRKFTDFPLREFAQKVNVLSATLPGRDRLLLFVDESILHVVKLVGGTKLQCSMDVQPGDGLAAPQWIGSGAFEGLESLLPTKCFAEVRCEGDELLICWADSVARCLLEREEATLGFLRVHCHAYNKDSPRGVTSHQVENVTYRRDAWRLRTAPLLEVLRFLERNRVQVVYLEHSRQQDCSACLCIQGYSEQSQRRCAYRREKNFFRFRVPMTCLTSSPCSPCRFSLFSLSDVLKAADKDSELVLLCRPLACVGAFTLGPSCQGLRRHLLFEIPTLPESPSEQID